MGIDVDFDTGKTLLQLEPEVWDPDELDHEFGEIAQHLVNKPLRKFSPAELHALIAQNMSLRYVAPLAIERLEADPFLEAGQYPGDLLTALLESDTRFWLEHYDLWCAVAGILATTVETIGKRMQEEEREDYMPWHVGDEFMAALLHFRALHKVEEGGTAN